jgi:hypothetical protein
MPWASMSIWMSSTAPSGASWPMTAYVATSVPAPIRIRYCGRPGIISGNSSKPVDDLQQLKGLEVASRRLARRATLRRQLPIEIGEERMGGANRPAKRVHEAFAISWPASRAWNRSRTRARNSSGTWSRSVMMLASKISCRSAADSASSSSADHTLRSTTDLRPCQSDQPPV